MKNVVWFVLAVCLSSGLVTACSSGSDKDPKGSHSASSTASPGLTIPTPTSSVSVKPADPAWSTKDAVAGYRAAMKPVTEGLTKLSKMSPNAGLKKTRAALVAYSQASTKSVESILAGKWGDDVRPAINILIAALLDQQEYFDALANGESKAAIQAQGTKTSQTLLVTRYFADEVEQKLGISDGLLDHVLGGSS